MMTKETKENYEKDKEKIAKGLGIQLYTVSEDHADMIDSKDAKPQRRQKPETTNSKGSDNKPQERLLYSFGGKMQPPSSHNTPRDSHDTSHVSSGSKNFGDLEKLSN